MARKIIQVPADEEFIAKLDRVRGERSRAEVMRKAFIDYFTREQKKRMDRAYLDGYGKKPEDSDWPEIQEEIIGEIMKGYDW